MSYNQQEDRYLDSDPVLVQEKTVVIRPGDGKAVGLGIYSTAAPNPQFDVTFTPDIQEDIGVTHEKLDIPGQSRYMLLYQFQNFSQKTCKVTMHLRRTAVLNR